MPHIRDTVSLSFLGAALALTLVSSSSRAGIIIDGTDANDHGSGSAAANFDGWKYMEKALTALAPTTSPGASKVVVDLGTTGTSQARSAIDSAFNLSPLPGRGWSLLHVDGAASISTYLSNLSTANTGLVYLPTYNLTSGDLTQPEMQAINFAANQIEAFVSSGGSLFAMGESNNGSNTGAYGWLQQLLPDLVANDLGPDPGVATDIRLTPQGAAAFPGLTNADLAGADPWHVHFSGQFGGLFVLGTAPEGSNTRNVILGNVGGSIVPEPSSVALMAVGVFVLVGYRRRAGGRGRARPQPPIVGGPGQDIYANPLIGG